MAPLAPRVFDAHFHVVEPGFPLIPNAGFVPAPFTVADYRQRTEPLGVVGGAVVSGSFQAFDTAYLTDALARLGPSFVGVAQLPASVSDAEVLRLDAAGVRAIRFNLRRGGSATVGALTTLARRVWDLAGWHAELYVDARDLPDLAPRLEELPRVVIDHLGLSGEGFPHLVHAVENGAFVKATGFGRLDADPAPAIRQLLATHPEAVVFGTDLPSTRAPRPFSPDDLRLVCDALDPDLADAVLYRNAVALYKPRI